MKFPTTAKEAAAAYRQMAEAGRIRQGFRDEIDENGVHVTDLVGAITPGTLYLGGIPESVMPSWLLPALTPWFNAGPEKEAIAWGQEMLDELARVDGKVPDRVRSTFVLRWTIPALRPLVREVWGARFDHVMDVREAAERSGDTEAIEAAAQLAREAYETVMAPIACPDKPMLFWPFSAGQSFCVDALFYHAASAASDRHKIRQRGYALDLLRFLP
jgi:hypothetical protein